MAQTDREMARLKKTRAQFDQMAAAIQQIVQNYNEAQDEPRDRIAFIPAQAIPDVAQGIEERTLVLQRRRSFVKLMMSTPGSLQITWGYQVPATGDRVFPEVNRLMLNAKNDWQLYRIRGTEEVHLERFDPDPGRLAKIMVERLIANAAIPPEVQPVLAL
jgi:hypothetical protein